MNKARHRKLDEIFREQLQALAATLRPSTIAYYRVQANRFLRFLRHTYPEVQTPGKLRRSPHILGWLRSLAEENPPLTNRSRRAALICVRRLLNDVADNGYPILEALILPQDFPPPDLYLPKPVSSEVDALLDRELRRTNDLLSNGLLLLRATGMRIGEFLRLNRDSLRHLGSNQWTLHVPLGKLHNERWVPIDDDTRGIFDRILSLVGPAAPPGVTNCTWPLLMLPNVSSFRTRYSRMRKALADAAQRISCPPIRLHQLRHTYATEMLRAGVSLPALKELLGHRDIRMTMRYVQVTQKDLQREYYLARQKMTSVHRIPQLPISQPGEDTIGIPGVCRMLGAIRHQLEMHRREISDDILSRKIDRFARRLETLRKALARL